jgi:hypothetical protein
MPKANPLSTKEKRWNETKKRWAEAERGTGGLKLLRFFDFSEAPNDKKIELLDEPAILTSDGRETCVVLSFEQYLSLLPPGAIPFENHFRRIDGELWQKVSR